jgi:hypothetical protein
MSQAVEKVRINGVIDLVYLNLRKEKTDGDYA